MSDQLWMALLLVAAWASLPVSIIIANAVFDKDVVLPGEDPHGH